MKFNVTTTYTLSLSEEIALCAMLGLRGFKTHPRNTHQAASFLQAINGENLEKCVQIALAFEAAIHEIDTTICNRNR